MENILDFVPKDGKINWEKLEKSHIGGLFTSMKRTPQSSNYHKEGDVFVHTKLVCESLVKLSEYKECSEEEKNVLFLSALLHDSGKTFCTRIEDGNITSRGHSFSGSLFVRDMLWRDFGLCGTEQKRNLRESVCTLVEYHSFPPYALSHDDVELRMIKTASVGKLALGFSLKLLYILAKADASGRISNDKEEQLEKIELFKLSACECGCFEKPWHFSTDFSERAYYKGKTSWKEQELFDNSPCKVILMSGLPGTGKDYWIEKNCDGLPVISLDDIRKKLKISPLDNQGKVISYAHEKAREFLRKKQSFVWNATNVTSLTRAKQISLFEKYGAGVKTVFLETEWNEQLRRNASRKDSVPEGVICKLLAKTEPPKPFECETVLWKTV